MRMDSSYVLGDGRRVHSCHDMPMRSVCVCVWLSVNATCVIRSRRSDLSTAVMPSRPFLIDMRVGELYSTDHRAAMLKFSCARTRTHASTHHRPLRSSQWPAVSGGSTPHPVPPGERAGALCLAHLRPAKHVVSHALQPSAVSALWFMMISIF